MNADKYPHILLISGFDPSGGAGLIADIETVHALGCRTSAVITCQTVQTMHNATACVPSDATWFKQQLHGMIEAQPWSAIKIGLTPSPEIIDIIADTLPRLSCPIVIDPIIAAGGGYVFCGREAVTRLAERLIPLCDIATPNAEELMRLVGNNHTATRLLERGCKAVLVTSEYEKQGYLYHCLYRLQHPPHTFTTKHLPHRYRGSGCTLASAIAAYLAHGEASVSAIEHAQQFTDHCLLNATRVEQGIAVPLRFKR